MLRCVEADPTTGCQYRHVEKVLYCIVIAGLITFNVDFFGEMGMLAMIGATSGLIITVTRLQSGSNGILL